MKVSKSDRQKIEKAISKKKNTALKFEGNLCDSYVILKDKDILAEEVKQQNIEYYEKMFSSILGKGKLLCKFNPCNYIEFGDLDVGDRYIIYNQWLNMVFLLVNRTQGTAFKIDDSLVAACYKVEGYVGDSFILSRMDDCSEVAKMLTNNTIKTIKDMVFTGLYTKEQIRGMRFSTKYIRVYRLEVSSPLYNEYDKK